MDDAGSNPVGASRIRARGPKDRALSFYLRGSRFESARACQCDRAKVVVSPRGLCTLVRLLLSEFQCRFNNLDAGEFVYAGGAAHGSAMQYRS